MNKKRGFTLVELLAVIVILAIILAIAIPGISSIIKSATKGALEGDAKMVLKGIEYKMLEDDTFDPSTVNETNIKSLLNIGDENYQSLTVKEINEIVYVTIAGKGKWDNLTASGTKKEIAVDDTVATLTRGANAPVLTTGMTPVKWNGTTWVNTTASDTAWYNYDTTNKIWANAKTADGSMWVWIPRYIYKIPTANWHTSTAGSISIQFSKGIDDNWNKAVIGSIDVGEGASASNNKWTNHPAFTFGNTELTGIWVAKFEVSGTTSALTSLPNVASLRAITIDSMFTSSRNMETNTIYGWGTTGNDIDTHLMKNTEWGAVAYLSQSVYGKNSEIWVNNSSTYITGCVGSSVSAAAFAGCENAYNTANGLQASTTGNIYGIYDISGGAWEYTAAYVDNGNAALANGSTIISADMKYKDVYIKGPTDSQLNNYALSIYKKGDAIYETSTLSSGTSSWNVDYSYMPSTVSPWFGRSGVYDYTTSSGSFAFGFASSGTGNMAGTIGFRPIIIVGTVL